MKNLKSLPCNYILGPCSAESEEQIENISKSLKKNLGDIDFIFRSGVWKPRTKPGGFEGLGEIALDWLDEYVISNDIDCAVEVANKMQVDLAVSKGIKVLWIGARTTCDPFAVQEIAEAVYSHYDKGKEIHVLIKNPISPDLELWDGAFQRFFAFGIDRIGAIFRGFHNMKLKKYRNEAIWSVPLEMMSRYPDMQMFCDPSHIAGKREYIAEIIDKANDLGFYNYMIEVHDNADKAWTDARQQISPDYTRDLIKYRIESHKQGVLKGNLPFIDKMYSKREMIDELDETLMRTLAKRFNVCKEIALIKKDSNQSIFQKERAEFKRRDFLKMAKDLNVSSEFSSMLWELIHKESIQIQNELLSKEK